MRTARDRAGERKGRLLVVRRARRRKGDICWLCRCDCGVEKILPSDQLAPSSNVRSCGCLLHEHDPNRRLPEYFNWANMKQRCSNPKNPKYSHYGGRGIKVCERWQSFDNFFLDMGRRPAEHMSIDRVDNDGDYEPNNCRWATPRQQRMNQRAPRYSKQITFNNKTQHASAWDREMGLTPGTIRGRISKGWSVEDALTLPEGARNPNGKKMLTFDGHTATRKEWAERLGITPAALTLRLKSGWSVKRALSTAKA